jgi:SNF2 family DNA or RNA helicase
LRVHIHHGQTKSLLRSKLEAAQIVLTTYETIAFGSRSTFGHLGQFSWFRIVLDEAHWVRNPSTQVFRALYEFEAQKRWCMTGTPVHNGLNDLCALTRWLKFYPFDTSHRFRKYITRPLYKLDEEGLINLRQMMKVFQIRRVKTEMKLSRVTPHLVTVSLPNQERRQYEQIKSALLMQLAELSKTKSSRSSIATLQGIRELRRMCCDGLALQAPYENHAAYISATSPEMSCNNCSQKVDERVLRSIFHGQCGHVFCKACYTSSSIGSPEQEATESPAVSCPICGSADEANCFLDGTLESVRKDLVLGVPHSPEPSIGNFVSAKITTVVSKLAELHQESAENSCKRFATAIGVHPRESC